MKPPETPAPSQPFWQRLADVEPHERRVLISAFLTALTMFAAYAILRPVRETMGITSGLRNLPALFWATFAAMLIAQPVYGWLVSRYPLRQVLPMIYMLFAGMLLAFYAWFFVETDQTWIARTYFVWVSVFNLFIVAVFWSLMADVFDSKQAARLFGVIAGGISTGGLVGPALAATLAKPLGTINLLLVSAALLFLSALLMRDVIRHQPAANAAQSANGENFPPAAGSAWDAFNQVLKSRYLLAISAFVLLLTSASTFLYLEQQRIVADTVPDRDAQTQLFARIDFWVQALSLAMQLILFSRILKRLGFTVAIGFVPLVLIGAFSALALAPSLAAIIAAMMVRRVGEYGLTRPCRDMLFTIVPREEKYKAKNLIDTFVYRGGDAISASLYAGLVWIFASRASEATIAGMAGAAICLLWLCLAFWLARRFNSGSA